MKKSKLKIILSSLGCMFILVVGGLYAYDYIQPYKMYQRALSQTTKEKKVLMQTTSETTNELNEIVTKSMKYALDRENKTFYLTKEEDNKETELLVHEKSLYLKIGDNEYTKITDSSYLDSFTNDIKYDGDTDYEEFQKQITQNIDRNNIKKETVERKIGDKDYNLTQLTLTVPKDIAKELISNYLVKDFNNNLDKLVDETISLQEIQFSTTDTPITEEDKENLKEEMTKLLSENIKEKVESIEFSDIKIEIAIDNKGYIRYRNESYEMIMDGTKNTINNINEYIDFGKNVEIISPDDIDLVDYEEYLEKQKEINQEKILKYTIENPAEAIDVQKISLTEDESINSEENKKNDETKKEEEKKVDETKKEDVKVNETTLKED